MLGGSGLIGSSLIERVSLENYKIINLDILKKNADKNIIFKKFDCTNLKNLEKKLLKIFEELGNPDCLVNCSYPITNDWINNNFKNIKIDSFLKNLNIHLGSYCWISKIFAEKMIKHNISGKIVMLSSIYGTYLAQNSENYKNTAMKENMTYPIIKSGISGATKQFAQYYGKNNIQVNSVCPGLIKGHVKGTRNKQDKKFLKRYLNKTSLKKICHPKEIADLINFLISDENTYITGQSVVIDGGYSIV